MAQVEARRMERWLRWCQKWHHPVTFLTLTFDPKAFKHVEADNLSEWLWDHANENKWVSRFFTRLGEHAGQSFKGKWRAKAEFHKSGMLHFHVLVRNMKYVHNDVLGDIWGHGYVSAKRANKTHAGYIAKYNAKVGTGYPNWLYDRPRRSVKIWGTSPGFFSGVEKERKLEQDLRTEHGVSDIEDQSLFPERTSTRMTLRRYTPPEFDNTMTNREVIEATEGRVVVREWGGEGKIELKCRPEDVVFCLRYMGVEYEGKAYGAYVMNCSISDIDKAGWLIEQARYMIDTARRFEVEAEWWATVGSNDEGEVREAEIRGLGGGVPPEGGPPQPLYLINIQDRDLERDGEGRLLCNPDAWTQIDTDDLPF